MNESLAKLRNVFFEVLGVDSQCDVESLTYRGVKEWDSVAHVQLVNALERAFDVMLETDDILSMSSFARSREILTGQGIKFDD